MKQIEERLPVTPTREYSQNCIWAPPKLGTPPATNSKAPGGPGVADGQGVCIPRYTLDYIEVHGFMAGAVCSELHTAADAAVILRSLLGRGVEAVTVSVHHA